PARSVAKRLHRVQESDTRIIQPKLVQRDEARAELAHFRKQVARQQVVQELVDKTVRVVRQQVTLDDQRIRLLLGEEVVEPEARIPLLDRRAGIEERIDPRRRADL